MLNILYNYFYYYVSNYFKSELRPHPKKKNQYFITYDFEGKTYNLLVSKKRGPNKIISVCGKKETNSEFNNIYDIMIQYLGPNHDFHGIKYTPSCLGMHTIIFKFMDDSEKVFVGEQVITL